MKDWSFVSVECSDMLKPRWHTKEELTGSCAFHIGDHDQFAEHLVKHQWYWTVDKESFFGSYAKKVYAERDWKLVHDAPTVPLPKE